MFNNHRILNLFLWHCGMLSQSYDPFIRTISKNLLVRVIKQKDVATSILFSEFNIIKVIKTVLLN